MQRRRAAPYEQAGVEEVSHIGEECLDEDAVELTVSSRLEATPRLRQRGWRPGVLGRKCAL